MRERSTFLRALLGGAAVAMVGSLAGAAGAKGPSPLRACTAAWSGAQEQARAGHLRVAKDLYLKCARTTCGALQRRCASAADETSSALPLVAFAVSDSAGTALVDVLVKMDGETLASHLDGRALPIDPGVHEFTFGARVGQPGRYVWLTRKIMVAEGQREPILVAMPPAPDPDAQSGASAPASVAARSLEASPADASKESITTDKASDEPARDALAAPTPMPKRSGPSVLPWVIGGAGVLGVGAGALLTYWGRSDNTALAQCSPDCSPAAVSHIHTLYVAADVSLAAGGAALGVAAILFATSHPREMAPTAASTPPRAAVGFDVQPTPSGALATVRGTF